MKNIKTMSGEEFRDKGYLQEANRRFFHPLGLALAMIIDKEKKNTVAFQILDSREDDEGFMYALNDTKFTDFERLERFMKNKMFVDDEMKKRVNKRIELFGNMIEPIPDIYDTKEK